MASIGEVIGNSGSTLDIGAGGTLGSAALINVPVTIGNGGTGKTTAYEAFDALTIHGADVASAGTIDLDSATGNLVDVTGTTTITAITLSNGKERTVRFTGILTLTNGASLVLPSGANITTAAGDYAIFRGYVAGVVRCVVYSKANGQAVSGGGGAGDVVGPGSATDGAPPLFDGTTGKLIKNSTPTGTGNPVLQTSPTLTTPVIGVASATTINKVALTAPATGSTLTIVDGKTLTVSKTITLTSPDDTSVSTLPAGTKTLLATDGNGSSLTGLTSTQVGLGNVTNDVQTKAAIVPNTAPSAGQVLVGNAGGTAYAPVSASGDATLASTGAITIAAAAVTLAKMANLAQDQFIGRTTASTGVPETATITSAARTVLDDTTVGAMVNTLGGATSTGTGGLVRATSPALVTPDLGTPSAVNLSNGTALPVGSVAGLGTGVATFLATPSSANLAAAVTGETGTGALVFATSPALVTPALGTVASGVVNACTGMPWQICFCQGNTFNPADAATNYLTGNGISTTDGTNRIYFGRAGTVKAAYVYWFAQSAAGSNESIPATLRINGSTDVAIASVADANAGKLFSNTGLAQGVNASDYFEIKFVFPTWVTNPTSVRMAVTLYIES